MVYLVFSFGFGMKHFQLGKQYLISHFHLIVILYTLLSNVLELVPLHVLSIMASTDLVPWWGLGRDEERPIKIKKSVIILDKTKSNSVVKLKYARYSLFDVQFTDIFIACRTLRNVSFDLIQMCFAFLQCDTFTMQYHDSFYIEKSFKQFYQVYLWRSDIKST